jgi:hypothetical protein
LGSTTPGGAEALGLLAERGLGAGERGAVGADAEHGEHARRYRRTLASSRRPPSTYSSGASSAAVAVARATTLVTP